MQKLQPHPKQSHPHDIKDIYLPIRLSHLLRHCSVGAIVRTPDYLLTIRDIRQWKDKQSLSSARTIPYVEQVKASLGIIQELREPPIAQLDSENNVQGSWLPAQVFPAWYVCQKCHSLHYKPWKTQPNATQGNYVCHAFCNGHLEQITLVQIHADGHMADVPWRNIAHNRNDCTHTGQPLNLKWDRKNNVVECKYCGRRGEVYVGMYLPFMGYKQPWLTQKPEFDSQSKDNAILRTLGAQTFDKETKTQNLTISEDNQNKEKLPSPLAMIMEVNDTRVHLAHNKSALVIPPESRVERGSVVDKLYCNSQLREQIYPGMSELEYRSEINVIAKQLNCEPSEVKSAFEEIAKGYPLYGKHFDIGHLLSSEYKALLELIPDLKDDEDFVTHHKTQAWQAFTQSRPKRELIYQIGQLFDKVVSVAKLKEILVFTGFSRGGEGMLSTTANEKDEADVVLDDDNPDITQIPKITVVPPAIDEDIGWLPALELYGEGIFIALNEKYLTTWENDDEVQKRTRILIDRYVAANLPVNEDIVVTARFLLLHALSHLLIRELESQAGYPAASLKEKIYAAQDINDPMAGILIYVAIPDVDGSLGGLAELAEPQRLAQLLTRVVEKAQWCSLDPVCSRHTGQGPGLLNLAACHACLLLPETSCCCGNILLDRKLVWGDSQTKLPSIFDIIKSSNMQFL